MGPLPLVMIVAFGVQGAATQAGAAPQTTPPTPAASAPADPGEPYFLYLQGHMLEGSGDVQGAITAYQHGIELDPKAADLRAELAGVYARAGRAGDAIAAALDALKVDPNNDEAHRILGLVQAAMADDVTDATRQANLTSEAIDHLERALAGGSHDLSAELTLGRLYVQGGQFAKGAAVLRTFLNDRPGYAQAVMLLADADDGIHQADQAIDVLQEFLGDEPADVRARARLASLDEETGRWKDAAGQWAELARRDPADGSYRLRQASALVNAGDLSAGRAVLSDLTKASPDDAGLWFLTAQIARRAGDVAGAEDAAHHIATIDPKDPRGPMALAEAKMAAKDYRAAADALRPVVASPTPDFISGGLYARAVSDLADALASGGDTDGAVQTLDDARTRVPGDESIVLGLAAMDERANHLDAAERVYRDLITKDPTDAEALNDFGYMLADHRRDLDNAVAFIKRALAVDADNPSYLDSLGWAYVQQGKLDLARPPLEKAAAALARNSVIQDHLGEAYFRLKRYKDAVDAWNRALAGDRDGIDIAQLTSKRDKALELVR